MTKPSEVFGYEPRLAMFNSSKPSFRYNEGFDSEVLPNKSRDIALVKQFVREINKELVVSEETNLYRPETGGVAPLQIIVRDPDRIVTTILIATRLRADGTPPSGTLFPVTFEGVKAKLEKGLIERNELDTQ